MEARANRDRATNACELAAKVGALGAELFHEQHMLRPKDLDAGAEFGSTETRRYLAVEHSAQINGWKSKAAAAGSRARTAETARGSAEAAATVTGADAAAARLELKAAAKALDAFLATAGTAVPDPTPSPPPPNEVAVELDALLDAEDLADCWKLWKLGEHMPEWLLLATAPFRDTFSGGPTLSEELTPGLWKVYISMLFVVLTDNTPCEQKVSCYRNITHFNQDETTAQARWKHLVRIGAERERLKAAAMRSNRGGALRGAAKAAAGLSKPLGHHAGSKASNCARCGRQNSPPHVSTRPRSMVHSPSWHPQYAPRARRCTMRTQRLRWPACGGRTHRDPSGRVRPT